MPASPSKPKKPRGGRASPSPRSRPQRAGRSARNSAPVSSNGRKRSTAALKSQINTMPTKLRPARSPASEITNYPTALKWLFTHTDFERQRIVQYNTSNFSLSRMRKLLDLLDNPHNDVKCVQIAGTKGKGSTCAMLASMLQAAGYGVGLYTSPHLVDLRERIQ